MDWQKLAELEPIFISNINCAEKPMHKLRKVKLCVYLRLKGTEDDQVTDPNIIPTLDP